jgi:SNF2 family DNA or RNA helicase
LAADQKLPQALDYVKNAGAGSSVVVFCYRRAVAEYFARETGGSFIHGGIPVSRRDKILTESRTRSRGVLAVTIDSCGVAIDMTFAPVACFAELTYDPNELLQAEKRVHRPGQKRPVLISYLLGKGSADELINQVVISRFRQDQAVLGATGEKLDSALGGAEMTTDDVLREIFAGVGELG